MPEPPSSPPAAPAALPAARRAPLAFGLLLAGHALLAAVGGPRHAPLAALAGWTLAGSGWALAVRELLQAGRAPSLRLVLLGAVALRLVAWAGAPSDDVARYVWEGRVQLAGHDPYRLPPDAPELAALAAHAPEHADINHPGWTAIYPPLGQLLLRGLVALEPGVWSLRAGLLAAELLLWWVLLAELRRRGLPDARVLVAAWSPLAILAGAHEAHLDGFGALLLLGALAAAVRGLWLAAGALGAGAGLVKLLPAAAAPALLPARGRRETPDAGRGGARALVALLAGMALVTTLALWPFRASGAALLRSLARFGAEKHYNDALPALLRAVVGPAATPWVLALLGAALVTWVLRRGRADPFHRAAVLLGGALLLLPTLHPWYLVPLLPLLALFPWWGWLAFSLTVALPWLALTETVRTGAWVEWPVLKLPEYLPLATWLVVQAVRARSVRHTPGAPPRAPPAATRPPR